MAGVKGRSGRHKVPTSVLARRGSWRAKVRKQTEPEIMPDKFVTPDGLSDKVQEYYNANLSDFKARGIISDTDSIAFEMLAKAYARWKAVESILRVDNNEIARMFVKEANSDKLIITDIAKEEKERFRLLKEILIQFGFTPATRADVNTIDVRNIKMRKIT